MKLCRKCNTTKPLTEFHRHSRDGYQSWCKDCFRPIVNEANKKRYRDNPAKYIQKALEYQRAYRAKDSPVRHKQEARSLVGSAVRRGRMIRQPCARCGAPKAQAHHHDYFKPLDVEWLCSACHGKEHRKHG